MTLQVQPEKYSFLVAWWHWQDASGHYLRQTTLPFLLLHLLYDRTSKRGYRSRPHPPWWYNQDGSDYEVKGRGHLAGEEEEEEPEEQDEPTSRPIMGVALFVFYFIEGSGGKCEYIAG